MESERKGTGGAERSIKSHYYSCGIGRWTGRRRAREDAPRRKPTVSAARLQTQRDSTVHGRLLLRRPRCADPPELKATVVYELLPSLVSKIERIDRHQARFVGTISVRKTLLSTAASPPRRLCASPLRRLQCLFL
ncbi:hypothetical protein AOLI_G00199550 [Acnodon oligacanthus]